MEQELNVKLSTELIEPSEEVKQKVRNFTKALKELPHEIIIEIKVFLDGKEDENGGLKIDIGDLLIEQVKKHFNKGD